MAKQYLDLTGLKSVINQIKDYYSTNEASTASRVAWASNAVLAQKASQLESGKSISISGPSGDTGLITVAAAPSFDGSAPVTIAASIRSVSTTESGLMSAADKVKLNGIETGAQENVIESVSVTVADTTATTAPSSKVSGKAVTITFPQYALKTDISAAINFRGTVSSKDNLPATGNTAGDVYIVKGDGSDGGIKEYIYVPAQTTPVAIDAHWEELGNTVALDGYYSKSDIDTMTWTHAKISDFIDTVKATKVNLAASADKLTTAKTIDFTGDVTGTQISFDGTTAVSTTLTIGSGKVTNNMLAGNIAQSKITNLETDLGSKIPKLTGDAKTAANGMLARFDSNGVVVASGFSATAGSVTANDTGLVTGGAVAAAIATAVQSANAAIEALDYSTTEFPVGYYVTGVTQTDGKIAITREAKGVAAASGSLDGVTGLVDGDAIDTALTGSYYITALTVPQNVFDTTAY